MDFIEQRKRELAERRKQLEERRRLLIAKRQLEDDELQTEEGTSAVLIRLLDERKRAIIDKRRLIEDSKRQCEEELRRVLEEEFGIEESKSDLEKSSNQEDDEFYEVEAPLPLYTEDSIENRIRMLEEKKLVLNQQKRIIQEKKTKAEQDLQSLGTLEQERIREQQISLSQIEQRRLQIRERRLELEALRRQEDEELKKYEDMNEPPIISVDNELKEKEIELKKLELEEKKRKLLREQEERAQIVALEQQTFQIEEQQHKLEDEERNRKMEELRARRLQIEEKRKQIVDEEETHRMILEQELARQKQDLERRREEVESLKREIASREVTGKFQVEEVERRKKILEDRKRKLKEEEESLEKTPTISPGEHVFDETRKKKLEEIEARKKEVLEKRRKIQEEEEETQRLLQEQERIRIQQEQDKLRLEQLESLKRKRQEDIDKRKLVLEEKRKKLELEKIKLDEDRRREGEERQRRVLDEINRTLFEEEQPPPSYEEQNKLFQLEQQRQELETKRREIEDKRKKIEESKQITLQIISQMTYEEIEQERQKMEKQRLEIEEKKRELEIKRKHLEEDEFKIEKLQDYVSKMDELVQLREVQEQIQGLERKKRELEMRKQLLAENRNMLQQSFPPKIKLKLEEMPSVLVLEEETNKLEQQRKDLEMKKKEIEEQKKQLEDSRLRVSQNLQQEEKIQIQKRELEKTKRKLQDRHSQLEKQRSYDNLFADTPILEPVTISITPPMNVQEISLEQEEELLEMQRKDMEQKRLALAERKQQVKAKRASLQLSAEIPKEPVKIEPLQPPPILYTPPLRTRAVSTPPGVIKPSEVFKQEVISEEALKIEQQRKDLDKKKQEIQDKRKLIEIEKLQDQDEMRKLKIEQKKKEIELKRKKLEEMKLADEQNRKNLIIDPNSLPSLAVPPLVKIETKAVPVVPVVPSTIKFDIPQATTKFDLSIAPVLELPPEIKITETVENVNIQDEIKKRKVELQNKRKQLFMEKETIHQMLKKEQLQVEIETNAAKQLEEKKNALTTRKKDVEKRKSALLSALTEDQIALQQEEEKQRIAAEQEFQERKHEIEERKKQLEDRRKALEQVEISQEVEIKQVDREEHKLKELEQMETKRIELEKRHKLMEEHKIKLMKEEAERQQLAFMLKQQQVEWDTKKKEAETRRVQFSHTKDKLSKTSEALMNATKLLAPGLDVTKATSLTAINKIVELSPAEKELEQRRKEIEEKRRNLEEKKRVIEEAQKKQAEEEQAIKLSQQEIVSKAKEISVLETMASGGSLRQKGKQKLLLNSVQQELLLSFEKPQSTKNSIFAIFAKKAEGTEETPSTPRRKSNSVTPTIGRSRENTETLDAVPGTLRASVGSSDHLDTRSRSSTNRFSMGLEPSHLNPLYDIIRMGDLPSIRKAVDGGANIVIPDAQGQLPLHVACAEAQYSIVEYLVQEKGANINAQDKTGWTPLHFATYCSSRNPGFQFLRVIDFLLRQSSLQINIFTHNYHSALHYFAKTTLLGKDDDFRQAFRQVCQLMVRRGIDVNIQNNKGETALHLACLSGNLEALHILLLTVDPRGDMYEEVPPLAINMLNSVGETALHYAAKSGNLEVVYPLLRHWIDLSIVSEQGTASEIAKSFNQSALAGVLDKIVKEEMQTKANNTVWMLVLAHLSMKDLISISLVCKQFRRLSDQDTLWKKHCIEKCLVRKGMKHSWKYIYKRFVLSLQEWRKTKQEFYEMNLNKVIKAESCIRGWVARNRYKHLRKMKTMRDKVMQELMETETTYIGDIKVIIKVFLNPLRFHTTEPIKPDVNPLITIEQIHAIFSDIELISHINNSLYENLSKRWANWSNRQMIGDIFVNMSESLKVYSRYFNNYERSLAVLQECRNNPTFAKWILAREQKDKLESFLIRPVQRIPRQKMLLEQILNNTWKWHPDYANLKVALQKVEAVMLTLNDRKRDYQNQQQMLTIEQSLDGGKIISPHRRFVKEGEMMEYSAKGNQIPIHLFLFNDTLLFARPQKKKTIPPKYKYLRLHRLHNMIVKDNLPTSSDYAASFALEIVTPKTSTILICHDAKVKEEWRSALRKAIQASKKLQSQPHDGIYDDSNTMEETATSDMPLDKRVAILEAALAKAKTELESERKEKEAVVLEKGNLERQLQQTLSMLNETSKLKDEAEVKLQKMIESRERSSSFMSDISDPNSDDEKSSSDMSELKSRHSGSVGNLKSLMTEKERKHLEKERKKQVEKEKKEREKQEKEIRKSLRKEEHRKSGGFFSTFSRSPSNRNSVEQQTIAAPKFETSSALHVAIKYANKDVVSRLLTGGTSINSLDAHGQSPMHIAAMEGNVEIVEYLFAECQRINMKIDLNVQDLNGWTALHCACYQAAHTSRASYIKICEILLQKGAQMYIFSHDLHSPIHFLVKTVCKEESTRTLFIRVLKTIMSKNIDLNSKNYKGETCLHLACSSNDAIRVILEYQTSAVDINMFTKVGESALHYAVRQDNILAASLLLQHFADYSIVSEEGYTARELAIVLKRTKMTQLLEEIEKKESQLDNALWMNVLMYMTPYVNELQYVPLVSKQLRRLSGRIKTQYESVERNRVQLELEKKYYVKSKLETANMNKATTADTVETLKLAKTHIEEQLKHAAALLTEETKKRIAAEGKVKESEDISDKYKYLEEVNKRQRISNDALHTQLVVQLEKAAQLEKQVKQVNREKLEIESKFEERMFFIERKNKEAQEAFIKENSIKTHELSLANKKLLEDLKTLRSKSKPETSTGPPIPPRPGQKEMEKQLQEMNEKKATADAKEREEMAEKIRNLEDAIKRHRMAGEALHEKYIAQTEKLNKMEKQLLLNQSQFEEREKTLLAKLQEMSKRNAPPPIPPRPEHSAGTLVVPKVTDTLPRVQSSRSAELSKLYPTLSQIELPNDKSFVRGPPAPPPSRGDKFEYDMWEAFNNTKLVVAFDAPGVDLNSMEIVIIGFTVRITRKLGAFEEKHLASGYKPTRRARFTVEHSVITDELKLPYLVRPDTKKAFHHHGTVYLTLEKLEVSMFTVSGRDWQEEPSF